MFDVCRHSWNQQRYYIQLYVVYVSCGTRNRTKRFFHFLFSYQTITLVFKNLLNEFLSRFCFTTSSAHLSLKSNNKSPTRYSSRIILCLQLLSILKFSFIHSHPSLICLIVKNLRFSDYLYVCVVVANCFVNFVYYVDEV